MASNSDPAENVPISSPANWLKLLGGRSGIFLSFLWGFAEGTLFFVVPDVFLSLVAVISPRRVWGHILSAVLGAVCAGAVMYAWAASSPSQAHRAVEKVPFIPQRMFDEVRSGYQRRGMTALFLGPFSGIPYKVYAIEAPGRFGLTEFAAATAPARAWRFIMVCLAFGVAATWLRQLWQKTPKQLATIHIIAWALFYACYWGRVALQ